MQNRVKYFASLGSSIVLMIATLFVIKFLTGKKEPKLINGFTGYIRRLVE